MNEKEQKLRQRLVDLIEDAEQRLDGKYGAPTYYEISEIHRDCSYLVRKLGVHDDEIEARLWAIDEAADEILEAE